MKKTWSVTTSAYSGTVTMFNEVSNFTSEELAKKVAEVIDEANKGGDFPTRSVVSETTVYEKASEVPILEEIKYTEATYSDLDQRILDLEKKIRVLNSEIESKKVILKSLIEKRDKKLGDLDGKYYKHGSFEFLYIEKVDKNKDGVLTWCGELFRVLNTMMTTTYSYTKGHCSMILGSESMTEISKEEYEKTFEKYYGK